jgi:hypothetical protein
VKRTQRLGRKRTGLVDGSLPKVSLRHPMQRSIEERYPVSDLGHARVVEDRFDRLVRIRALDEEDDLGLRQEDCLSVEGCPDALVHWVFGEKLLRSLATVGSQASHEYVPVHRHRSVLRRQIERLDLRAGRPVSHG